MDVRVLEGESERRAAAPLLQQLWTDRDRDEIVAWTGEEEYRLFGGFADDELVGVAGVVIQQVLHHRRHAWLYDLVVDEPRREEGYGTELVRFVEKWAKQNDCEYVALASPVSKEEVHQYYEKRNYDRWGYVIEKEL
ncbi:GNAT family N-acetyltransferase [Haladaptatus salinisoli]|uniref:GNAT family N-acetyltransferase n=1 Tax=Haladaptatus salinisoli TaxID=2884876 RepID=UPI001D0B5175|nr:GNAT family N-acetyltransferase [Haladaptatus salinisoli]